MWREDANGTEFTGPAEAYKSLRARAERTIAEGDRQGFDLRGHEVQLKDDQGTVLFEGTLEDATRLQIDGRIFLPSRSL